MRGRLVNRSLREEAVTLIRQACDEGARRAVACAELGISGRTFERWCKQLDDQRQYRDVVPTNKLSAAERQNIIDIATSSDYCDLPACKIVPILADNGQYIASESTFYRILREERLLAHRSRARKATHKKPQPHTAHKANQVWCWDITYCPSNIRGQFYYLYLILDLYSRKVVGWTLETEQNDQFAALLIEETCQKEGVMKDSLVLHSDNGGPMKGATMLAKLEDLGVLPSFSRPRVSDDNPFAESIFRTLKYRPNFPYQTKFNSIDDARIWVEKFVSWYNDEHLHSGLKFITPAQRHDGKDSEVMDNRKQIYAAARQKHPERWRGEIRNWRVLPDNCVISTAPT